MTAHCSPLTGEVTVSTDDRTRVHRLLATSLEILTSPLPQTAVPSPPNETRPHSAAMVRLMAVAARVAALDSTILITGESGVGKERLARWLHEASSRARGPFIAVNCGAFADTILESELFGHTRGAFTGAVQDRVGVFEAAAGGTLFLDEVGEVSPAMQVKLLRVIQEREVIRLGETKTRRVDVRLIAATNRDLLEELAQGRFRRDLYYRLRVIDLHVPPLRDRLEELHGLAHEILTQMAVRLRRSVVGYTEGALDCLLGYTWPGNIRELEHAIERACAVATGPEIDVEDLPDAVRGGQWQEPPSRRPLDVRELVYIRAVLARHGGNRRRAAAELGISLSTLKRRLRKRTGPLSATLIPTAVSQLTPWSDADGSMLASSTQARCRTASATTLRRVAGCSRVAPPFFGESASFSRSLTQSLAMARNLPGHARMEPTRVGWAVTVFALTSRAATRRRDGCNEPVTRRAQDVGPPNHFHTARTMARARGVRRSSRARHRNLVWVCTRSRARSRTRAAAPPTQSGSADCLRRSDRSGAAGAGMAAHHDVFFFCLTGALMTPTVALRGLWTTPHVSRWRRVFAFAAAALVLMPTISYAQAGGSPWENAVNVLMTSFTGPIARGLSLISIVIGGVTFAFGEGGSKRLIAGIVFGVGMAIGAVNFMAWLFP